MRVWSANCFRGDPAHRMRTIVRHQCIGKMTKRPQGCLVIFLMMVDQAALCVLPAMGLVRILRRGRRYITQVRKNYARRALARPDI